MRFDSFPLHYKDDLLLVEEDPKQPWKLHHPYSLRDYALVSIVRQGEVEMNINGVFNCRIADKGIVYHLPDQIFTLNRVSEDLQVKHIIMSSAFIAHLGLDVQVDMPWLLHSNPFLPLEEQGMAAILNLYTMIEGVLLTKNNPHQFEILQHLLQAYHLSFDFYYRARAASGQSATREHRLTQQFFALLRQNGFKEHGVQFYADQLHLTPKYLTTCIQHATGNSAKQCIDKYLLSHAQRLLTIKGKDAKTSYLTFQRTVSEVAYELGFPDPATFSRYFYTHTGLRPKEWRGQYKNDPAPTQQ